MGTLETRIQRKKPKVRMTKWQKGVLKAVAAAGMLSVAVVAPSAFKVVASSFDSLTKENKQAIRKARDRLIKHGLLEYDAERRGFLRLTTTGERALQAWERLEYKIEKPRKWDERWRVLIFDIVEKKRELRDRLRDTLTAIGFVRLQDSVWLYPYPCEDFIELLKADFELGRSLLYMVVEELEGDKPLLDFFGLARRR